MATIHDVARAAGVSTATVSRSFTLRHPLRDNTRERVLREAERLNYRPRRTPRAKDLAAGKGAASTSIGFQYFQSNANDRLPTNAFYAPVLAGAQHEADRLGMHLMLHSAQRHTALRALPQMIAEHAVPAMLLVGMADPELLREFLRFVPTIVLVDTRDPFAKHDCVVSAGLAGAGSAVRHLVALGHTRIAFVGNVDPECGFAERLDGYVCAVNRAGLPVERHLMCSIDEPDISTDMSASIGQIAEFLRPVESRPTAIVAANDAHALAVMHACRRLGMELPRDMSIVGFDDTDFSAHMYPALTTVRVEKEQMGRVAVRRLARRLHELEAGGPADPPLVLELPVTLVERASCAPPRGG